MTLIVEDGSGIYEANSYAGLGFVRSYLSERGKATDWLNSTREVQQTALIAATDYVDKRFGPRFQGVKEFTRMPVAASNILTFFTNASEDDEITIGAITYTFKVAAATANEITIGANAQETSEALVAAIAGTGGGSGTVAHPSVSSVALTGSDAVLMRALVAGPLPVAIGTSSNTVNLSWDTPALTGGQQFASQHLEFPRTRIYDRSGNHVTGIPLNLKKAIAEYASRAISITLMPDPVVDDSGQDLARIYDKVGPIESDVRYVFGSRKDLFKRFPEADKLLSPYLMNSGQVFR